MAEASKKSTTSRSKKSTTPAPKAQHVTPHPDGGWQVKGEGNKKATKRVATKEEAVYAAKKIADNQNSRIVPHKKDGTIQKKKNV